MRFLMVMALVFWALPADAQVRMGQDAPGAIRKGGDTARGVPAPSTSELRERSRREALERNGYGYVNTAPRKDRRVPPPERRYPGNAKQLNAAAVYQRNMEMRNEEIFRQHQDIPVPEGMPMP